MISSSSNAGANRRSTAVYPSSIPRILYHQRAAKKGREVIKSTSFSNRHQISDPRPQIREFGGHPKFKFCLHNTSFYNVHPTPVSVAYGGQPIGSP